MATIHKSHPLNVPGPLYTDTTCIDCGTCYHLGPDLFNENSRDDKSVVVKQPFSLEEWQGAKRAILSCPTNSIGVTDAPEEFKGLSSGLPLQITEEVYYLGFTSRDSFGATSYLIVRDEGNVMVDSPRFQPSLVREIEKLGGVKFMVLTHQDDVADHEKFHQHFGLERVIHEDDVTRDTAVAEKILSGSGPFHLAPDLKIITTPGHTQGHVNLLFKNKYLFTGDHLFVENGEIVASRSVCWYSWAEQISSVEKLLEEKFEWVMPGHGGWEQFQNPQRQIEGLIQKMKQEL